MGRIQELAQRDSSRMMSGKDETPITFVKGEFTATIKGQALVHHLAFNTDGQVVNSITGHITVVEKKLTDLNFPVRNLKDEVFLRDALVTFSDQRGISKTYIVKENFADESIGVIVLNLGMYVS